MGNANTNSSSAPSSPSRWQARRPNGTSKQIHISTDHADGFYFTGERLTGTVKIPVSFLHPSDNRNNRAPAELIYKRSLRCAMVVELVGDATYAAQVDVAADSNGHATHKVNLCRHRSIVTIHHTKNESESIMTDASSDEKTLTTTPPHTPIVMNGSFQMVIPEGLPPSLVNSRTPSVVYRLELSLSSSRCRYQIPITLSARGSLPPTIPDTESSHCALIQHDIRLGAHLPTNVYQPGEQIPVRIDYSNPQHRFIRSIVITLMQVYHIHNDQYRSPLDAKEWTFDVSTMMPQREWTGEVLLQLPVQPLSASYSTRGVGTTQSIQCDLDYCIQIELSEKKGEDMHLTLPSLHVTYQK